MGVLQRLKNTYSYGGFREVARKAFFLVIYRAANRFTLRDVRRAPAEYGLNKEKREKMIVVSLTSFPARFSQLSPCLNSLIKQKTKPDRIIVYLGSDTDESMITEEMRGFEQYGVEFRIDKEENLMPHKKYFYAMQEYPDAIVITADDDAVYPRDWVDSLYQSFLKYPVAVSARRVHLMKRNGEKLLPYDHWEDQCRRITVPSFSLIATGNSGVLYPPHCLSREAFDIDSIKKLCLRADDLWLKCNEVKNGVPVVWVENWEVKLTAIDSAANQRLSDENIFTGTNDEVLSRIMEHLGLENSDFFDRGFREQRYEE